MDNKVRVNFYKAEVKYAGSLEAYTLDDLVAMAKIRAASKGVDIFDHYEDVDVTTAMELEGKVEVICHYWGNQIALIGWSNIEVKKRSKNTKNLKLNNTLEILKAASTNLEDNVNKRLSPEDMTNVNLGIISTILGDIAFSLAMIADNTNKEEAENE